MDSRPRNPDIVRFLVTIEEGGSSQGQLHTYLVATSGARDKAVAIAVEAFRQPEAHGEPRRTIRNVRAEVSPGPIENDTLQDFELDS